MYGSLLELLPPGGIDKAIEARITGLAHSDLLLVRSNILEIYSLVNERIQLYSRHHFAGRILDLHQVPGPSGDQLFVVFPGNQVSLLAYQRELRDFTTISLHSFSGAELQERSVERPQLSDDRLVAVDEGSRCAAIRVGHSHLVLIPLAGNETGDQPRWRRTSVRVPFSQVDERLRNVIQIAFLPGYLETTMAILYEPKPTWPYQLPVNMDTVCLLVVALNFTVEQRPTFTTLAHYDRLPSDIKGFWTPSAGFPIKGILLPGTNEIIYIDPGNPTVSAISTNSFSSMTTKIPSLKKSVLQSTFSHGCIGQLDNKLLILSDDGSPFYCSLHRDGSLRRIELTSAELFFGDHKPSTPIKTICFFGPGLLALIPSLGDVIILSTSNITHHHVNRGHPNSHSSNNNVANLNNLNNDDDNDEDDIYGETTSQGSSVAHPAVLKTHVKVLTTIPVYGPISDFCIGGDPKRQDFEIVVSSGDDFVGMITFYRRNLPLQRQHQFNISNCKSIFALEGGFFIVSGDNSSSLLHKVDNIIEKAASALVESESTLAAFNIFQSVIQVTQGALRLLTADLSITLSEIILDNFAKIKKIAHQARYVAILYENGALDLYHMSEKDVIVAIEHDFEPARSLDIANEHLCIVFEHGRFDIIKLEGLKVIFTNDSFHQMPTLLKSTLETTAIDKTMDTYPLIINDCALLFDQRFGYLMAVSTDTLGLVIYRSCDLESFVRLPSSQYSLHRLFGTEILTLQVIRMNDEVQSILIRDPSSADNSWIVHFDSRGYPRIHSIKPVLGSRIISFSTFGPFGIYEANGSFSTLDRDLQYSWDLDLPFKRITLSGESVRSVVYHLPSDSYALLTTRARRFTLPKDDHAPISDNDVEIPEGAPRPFQRDYSLKLLSAERGVLIDEYSMNEDEYALCMVSGTLETKQTSSGRQAFICVGTSHNRGEDRPARGRVLVFDIIEVVPDPDRPESDRRLKLLTDAEMKGPATCLNHINGHLAIGLASKVILHSFEDNESLTGVAFVDVGVYSSCLATVKSFFAVGDVCKSLSFHAFQEKPAKIVTLGRDFEDRFVNAVEFMVDGKSGETALVASDLMGNVHLLEYSPTSIESDGGTRLVSRGSIKLSEPVQKMRRALFEDTQVCLMNTHKGALYIMSPVDESVYRRSYSLQLRLAAMLPHPGGVHSRAARQVSPIIGKPLPLARTILDATPIGLVRVLELPLAARMHLARILNDEGSMFRTWLSQILKASSLLSKSPSK